MDKKSLNNQNVMSDKNRSSFGVKIPAEIRKEAERQYKIQEKKRKEREKHYEELQAKRKKLLDQKLKLQEKLILGESLKLQESLKSKLVELEEKIKQVELNIKDEESQKQNSVQIVQSNKLVQEQTMHEQEFVDKNYVDVEKLESEEQIQDSLNKEDQIKDEITKENNIVANDESVQALKAEVVEKKEANVETNNLNESNKTQKISLDELQKAKEEINREKEEAAKKESKKKKSTDIINNLPPEESLTDDLSDEELERYILEEQKAQERALLEEEQKAYEGMTEEEIKEAKSRRLKFLELQKRYNSRENVNPSDMGDYQKNLDFTINKSLNKFKVKPPKALFKVIASVFIGLLVIGAVVAYIIVNKPPEPVVLTSIRLSQTKTYQTVGEQLDLRGLYIYCSYSNGTDKTLKADNSLISRTSSNINSNRKIILDISNQSQDKESAFVYFAVDGQEVKLDITLTIYAINSVSSTLYVDTITAGDFISFDNILLLAQTSDDRKLRIMPDDCLYKIGDTELTKTDNGFYIPTDIYGAQTLTIVSNYNSKDYTSYISIYVEELIEESEQGTDN